MIEKTFFLLNSLFLLMHNKPLLINAGVHTIVTTFFVLILGLITLIFILHRRQIIQILQATFSQRIFSQLLRESKLLKERIFFLQHFTNYLILSLFVFIVLHYFFPNITQFFSIELLFLIAFSFVFLDFLFKRLALSLYIYLSDYKENKDEFYFYKLFHITSNCFILYPILIIFFFTQQPIALLIYLPFFIISFIFLFSRFYTFNKNKNLTFHFFLYFCTIEILPYVILLKIIFSLGK